MIKIYHNPRCRKSREGLAIIEKSNKEFEIVRYLDDIPSAETFNRDNQIIRNHSYSTN